MQGRGEIVTPVQTETKLYALLLCPPSSVSSKDCYHKYDELGKNEEENRNSTQFCIEALCGGDVEGVGRYLMNDLFMPATHLNDDVYKAYSAAKSFSPLGVVMTGSGSGVLALFETKELCEWAKSRYFGKARAYVVQTILPDYQRKAKKGIFSGFRNPFVLTDEEKDLLAD